MACPNGLVFGHSFVKQLSRDLGVCPATALKVDDKCSITLRGVSGAMISTLYPNCRLSRPNIDFLVVDLGSNDLIRDQVKSGKEHAQDLFEICLDILKGTNIKHITILGITKRIKCRTMNNDIFELHRNQFNCHIKDLISNVNNMKYVNCCGLDSKPIEEWSNDGIHPNSTYGKIKLKNRVRSAIFEAISNFKKINVK